MTDIVRLTIATPVFGYKNHVGIDRAHGFVRRFAVTHAARHDGSQLAAVLDGGNTASDVWADTAYRSQANLALLQKRGLWLSSSAPSRAAGRCRRTSTEHWKFSWRPELVTTKASAAITAIERRRLLISGRTQNNLGEALHILGERESGMARLKAAVTAYRPRQRDAGTGAQPGRTRLRRQETPHAPGRAHHRSGPGDGEDHARQPGL